MLSLLVALALTSPPSGKPRPKPGNPEIFAQVFNGAYEPQLGPELVQDVASPAVDFTEGPEFPWLAVEVPAAVGTGAGEGSPRPVELTVKQNKRTRVFSAHQRTQEDAVTVPFFVPIERCGDLELSAKVGSRKSPVVKIKVKC